MAEKSIGLRLLQYYSCLGIFVGALYSFSKKNQYTFLYETGEQRCRRTQF